MQQSVGAPGAFGENENRSACSNLFGGFVKAFQCLTTVGAVNGNISDLAHGLAEERDAEEFFFCDPTKIVGKVALKRENVILAAVVTGEDIGLLRINIVNAFHGHPYTGEEAEDPSPVARENLSFDFRFSDPQ